MIIPTIYFSECGESEKPGLSGFLVINFLTEYTVA